MRLRALASYQQSRLQTRSADGIPAAALSRSVAELQALAWAIDELARVHGLASAVAPPAAPAEAKP
jgi:hypothetical protein